MILHNNNQDMEDAGSQSSAENFLNFNCDLDTPDNMQEKLSLVDAEENVNEKNHGESVTNYQNNNS